MKRTGRNNYWMIAGSINSFTALLHLIGGQIDLVNPLLDSDLSIQIKTQWLGAWHIVTILLFVSSYYLIKHGLIKSNNSAAVIQLIGILYLSFAIAFIISSLYTTEFAPQWILLLPIGVLSLIGIKYANQ